MMDGEAGRKEDQEESGRKQDQEKNASNIEIENMELRIDTEKDEGKSPVTDAGSERDDVPAESGASEPVQQNVEAAEVSEAPAGQTTTSTPGPGEDCGDKLPSGDIIATGEDLGSGEGPEKKSLSCEGSVIFEVNHNDDDDGLSMLDLETPEGETSSPVREEEAEEEEEEEGEVTAACPDEGDVDYEGCVQLLQQLHAEREKPSQHSIQLQAKLLEYFRKKSGDDAQLEKMPLPDQEQLYEKNMNLLASLKQHYTTNSETAEQQAEELRLQSQEKLGKVQSEWRAFMVLKQDVAVTLLSRRLGKQVAQAKLESILASEQHRQDELVRLRLEHIKLKTRTRKLEEELHIQKELANGLRQLDFKKMQAENQKFNEKIEKQSEELFKLRKKISSTMEVLTNVKEKLQWSQTESRAMRAELAEAEAAVAGKRDLLTRIKRARSSLHRDNLSLKQRCGLLGNSVLLRDFEDSVDASVQLEHRLADLESRQAQAALKCGVWEKTMKMT